MTLARTCLFALLLCANNFAYAQIAKLATQATTVKVGDAAPEIKLEKLLQAPALAGTATADLKGKVVVLEFWATWCLPCVPAFRHLNGVAEKFRDRPVQFIAVTDEEDELLVRKFLKEQPVMGWVGMDTDRSVFTAYRAGGRPHTVLIDREGKIAAITDPRSVTSAALDALLEGKVVSLPPKPLASGLDVEAVKSGGAELFQATVEPAVRNGPLYGALLNVPGHIESDGTPILHAITAAYRTSVYRVVEGVPLPKEFYRFKVLVPKGREELAFPVLQQVLEVTFGLKVRREVREVEAFVLRPIPGGASSLRPSQAAEASPQMVMKGYIRAKRQPIKALADVLESDFLKRPVVDETGLKAEYDWDLPFNRASNNVLLEAIRTQLGLEAVKERRRVEFLVIDSFGSPPKQVGVP